MAETAGDNVLIFKTTEDEWGEFSNQYPAPFDYMGIRFESVEQFLYYMKAVFGRSKATAEKILACGSDSSALSKASKKQRLLESNSWEAVRSQIMRLGMRQKFLQNPELRRKLLSTGFRLIVEIPKEGLLGRIIPANEDWVRDPGKWKGRNQTGKTPMQVRADLRCADRLVGPDEAYVFPKEPFILQTPVGQMSLKEISALPGARESVRTYAEIAQQYQELLLANADDFISRHQIPLVRMEQAIASNEADIRNALNLARARAAVPGNTGETNPASETEAEAAAAAKPEDFSAEGSGTDAQDGAEAPFTPSLDFGSAPQEEARPAFPEETQAEAPGEKLPDDIPAEGFYELLYDLDEMMKLGII